VDFVIEPINDIDIPGFFLTRQDEGAAIVEAIGVHRMGLQCDLYHTVMKGDDPAAIVKRLQPVIRHVQFADAPAAASRAAERWISPRSSSSSTRWPTMAGSPRSTSPRAAPKRRSPGFTPEPPFRLSPFRCSFSLTRMVRVDGAHRRRVHCGALRRG
jgi:hypothetical protein